MNNKCALAPKHRWEWCRDVTLLQVKMNARGTTRTLSRRGVYKCACGQTKHGIAKSGL